MRRLLFLLFSLVAVAAKAQSVSNVSFTQQGDKVQVLFDLDNYYGEPIDLFLYYSDNNGSFLQCNSISNTTVNGRYAIIWQPLQDNIKSLYGKRFRFKVSANLILPETPQHKNYTDTIKGVSFNMVYVEGGTFEMGSNKGDDEKPIHSVTLSEFYMAETEVTQELYEAVMGVNPSRFKGKQNPVENVSWNDAQAFLKKLNQLSQYTYLLPSEAQWEYAAGGGATGRTKWAGTDNEKQLGEYAVYMKNSSSLGSSHKDYGTHPVKTKLANRLGLHDMSGNVWEWCEDWYDEKYYEKTKGSTNPLNKSKASFRVLRGGSWNYSPNYCRVAYRSWNYPVVRYNYNGFRVIRSVP